MKDHEPQGDKVHQYANMFPMMSDEELAELAKDIDENGQQNPIIIDYDGYIVDGRNRYAACKIAGVEPEFRKMLFSSEEQKLNYVIGQNLHRRHLDTSQRAMIAARLRDSFDALAKARMESTQSKKGEKVGKAMENFPYPSESKGTARDKAGEALQVSGKTVDMATKVIEKAVPEVVQAVDRGELAVSRAAKIAELPQDQQAAAIEKPAERKRNVELFALVRSNGPVTPKDLGCNQDSLGPSKGLIVFRSYDDALDEGAAYFDIEEFDAVPLDELLRGYQP